MLESGLFFTLGFLAAALLALMIAPAIWRRAVSLTRQRIESSVPLTLNEIQADKDQLRAEFAMSTRRLEVSVETLKERAAEQLIEINRRRDQVLELEEAETSKATRISELQDQSDELRAEMRDREERLGQTSLTLANLETRMEEKALEYENLERRYHTVIDEFDDQKIELVARETRLDGVGNEVRDMKTELLELRDTNSTLKDEHKAHKALMKREKAHVADLEKKLERMQSATADMEARLERRDRDIAKLRDRSGATESRASKESTSKDKILAENVQLKAELAEAAMRTEALLKDASSENVENAVAIFENERKELRAKLKAAEAARDEMRVELSAVQISNDENWDIERRENAIVRERINDLAARVAAMTAEMEGQNSPIYAEVAKAGGKGKSKTTVRKGAKVASVGKVKEDVTSLADRIRALQEAAQKA